MNNNSKPAIEDCRDYLQCCDFEIKDGNPDQGYLVWTWKGEDK